MRRGAGSSRAFGTIRYTRPKTTVTICANRSKGFEWTRKLGGGAGAVQRFFGFRHSLLATKTRIAERCWSEKSHTRIKLRNKPLYLRVCTQKQDSMAEASASTEDSMAALIFPVLLFSGLVTCALFWCLLSSCLGTSILQSLGTLWEYLILSAKNGAANDRTLSRRRAAQGRFAEVGGEEWEMNYR
ncbi:hypothetical protein C8R43DRAFT_415014 [Mycena crocata]|nr:hypothetical protein C8R43DRAFT_415014 [Mycena crocata]